MRIGIKCLQIRRSNMNKQFRGIALLLFGILLAITSIPMENFMPGEYYMLPCLIGVGVGVVGVAHAFSNEE